MEERGFHGYRSYDDWYDNGPGSENFKREVAKQMREAVVPIVVATRNWVLQKKQHEKIKKECEKLEKNTESLKEKLKKLKRTSS